MSDLQETLERAIPAVPEPPLALPDPAARVQHGRRVLRRRRIVGGVGATAAATLVVAGAMAGLPIGPGNDTVWEPGAGADTAANDEPAGERDTELLWRLLDPVPGFAEDDFDQAFFDRDGVLVIRPEATVVRQDDRAAEAGVPLAAALITERDGVTHWTVVQSLEAWSTAGLSAAGNSITPDEAYGATFEQWVRDVEAAGLLERPVYLELREDELSAVGGATLVESTVPDATVLPEGRTGAIAIVDVDGASVCTAVRTVRGIAEVWNQPGSQFPFADCVEVYTPWIQGTDEVE